VGSTDEIGIFEMTDRGLEAVVDPSAAFANGGAGGAGSVLLPAIEGSRPILLELQALVAPTDLAMPRRAATGLDRNRLAMIVAVLGPADRGGVGGTQIFIEVPGGGRGEQRGGGHRVAV